MPGRTPDRGRHVGMRGGGQSREQLAVSMSQLVVRAPCVASWGVPVMLVPMAVAVSPALQAWRGGPTGDWSRSEEHTSELQSLMRRSYAVFCLKKQKAIIRKHT